MAAYPIIISFPRLWRCTVYIKKSIIWRRRSCAVLLFQKLLFPRELNSLRRCLQYTNFFFIISLSTNILFILDYFRENWAAGRQADDSAPLSWKSSEFIHQRPTFAGEAISLKSWSGKKQSNPENPSSSWSIIPIRWIIPEERRTTRMALEFVYPTKLDPFLARHPTTLARPSPSATYCLKNLFLTYHFSHILLHIVEKITKNQTLLYIVVL